MKDRLLVWISCFGVLVMARLPVWAQRSESYNLIPESPFAVLSYTQTGQADIDSGGEFARHDTEYRGEMSLFWNDPVRFSLLANLRWTRIALDDTPVGELDVYKGLIGLDGQHEGLYPLTLRGRILVGLLSDLDEIDGNDGRLRGNLVAELPLVQGLSAALGGAYDEALGDDEWHLVGGIKWQPSEVFLLELQYPQSRAVLAPTHGLAFMLEAGYAGDNWAIFHDKLEHNLRIKSFKSELGAEAELVQGVWLRLFGGWLTDQSVDVWKGWRRPVQGSMDDTYYGGVALMWR